MAVDILDELRNMVTQFDIDNAEAMARKAIEQGVNPLRLVISSAPESSFSPTWSVLRRW